MHFGTRAFGFPDRLEQALSKALWGATSPAAQQVSAAARELARLWPLLAKKRGQEGAEAPRGRLDGRDARRGSEVDSHYSFDASLAQAYAAYYLPANLMKVPLILEELRVFGLALEQGPKLRWMDVGTGPGTAFWGLAWWAAQRKVEFEFWGLEQSLHFLSLAGRLARGAAHELYSTAELPAPVAHWEAFRHTGGKGSTGEKQRQGARSLVQWVRAAQPHVVSMMNSIAELVPDVSVRAEFIGGLLDELGQAARADGKPRWLILIEPGSKASSRELLEVRDRLRSRAAGGDLRIWLPCLDERPCGALAAPGDWCHEEAACEFPEWMEQIGAGAGLKKESLLFSYLVCSVGVHPKVEAWPAAGQRVVSQLLREKGLVQCFLCTQQGKVKARVLNSRQTGANTVFTESVRGQVYAAVQRDEKGDVQGVSELPLEGEPDPTVFPRPRSDRRS